MDEHVRACLQAILDGKQLEAYSHCADKWSDAHINHVMFLLGSNNLNAVRIKPVPVCELAGVQFPLPMQEAPEYEDDYYVASPQGVTEYTWRNDDEDMKWLALHICHTTFEAAETHSKAMCAVNAQAVEKAHAGGVK